MKEPLLRYRTPWTQVKKMTLLFLGLRALLGEAPPALHVNPGQLPGKLYLHGVQVILTLPQQNMISLAQILISVLICGTQLIMSGSFFHMIYCIYCSPN